LYSAPIIIITVTSSRRARVGEISNAYKMLVDLEIFNPNFEGGT
jgi:hypothetical protein